MEYYLYKNCIIEYMPEKPGNVRWSVTGRILPDYLFKSVKFESSKIEDCMHYIDNVIYEDEIYQKEALHKIDNLL